MEVFLCVALRSVTPLSPLKQKRVIGTPHPLTLDSLCDCACTCNRCARSSGCLSPPSCAWPCGSGTRFSPASPRGSNTSRFRFFLVLKDTCLMKTPFPVPKVVCWWKPCASSCHSVCGYFQRRLLEENNVVVNHLGSCQDATCKWHTS